MPYFFYDAASFPHEDAASFPHRLSPEEVAEFEQLDLDALIQNVPLPPDAYSAYSSTPVFVGQTVREATSTAASTPPDSAPRLSTQGFVDSIRGSYQGFSGSQFLNLPTMVVKVLDTQFGIIARCGRRAGRLRLELIVLSCMAAYWKRSKGRVETITYHDGVKVTVDEDEFVVSLQTVARALWELLRMRPAPAIERDDKEFDALYRSVVNAAGRLEEAGFVRKLGFARPDSVAPMLYGQRWSMAGTAIDAVLEDLEYAAAPLAVASARRGGPSPVTDYSEKGVCRVLDLVLDRVAPEVADGFIYGIAKSGGHRRKGRAVKAHAWQQRHARAGGNQPLHVSVGAFQKGVATAQNRSSQPLMVPYLIAEIDGADAAESLDAARRILDRLEALGANLKRVVVTYTGNRSFHVRVPHGMIGCPIYRDATAAQLVIHRFWQLVCDDDALFALIDKNAFSPLNTIRAVGSTHEKLRYTMHCVAFDGNELRRLGMESIEEYSARYSRFRLYDPKGATEVPRLVEIFEESVHESMEAAATIEYKKSRGIIDRILQADIHPGQEFAPGHVGRNKAAFLLALYLLTRRGMSLNNAWDELQAWNNRLPVPIGQHQGDYASELLYVLKRAQRYAMRSRAVVPAKVPEKVA